MHYDTKCLLICNCEPLQFKWSALTRYIQTMGLWNIISIILSYILIILFEVWSGVWLKNWTDNSDASSNVFFWLSGYSAISVLKGMSGRFFGLFGKYRALSKSCMYFFVKQKQTFPMIFYFKHFLVE